MVEMIKKLKVVILCGGEGTRLREHTEFTPKPLVRVGDMPILWHIMKIYSHFGYNDFVLCLGYKGHMIKEFFMNYEWMTNDFTLKLKSKKELVTHYKHDLEDWTITFADTGLNTLTAGRIKKIEKYVNEDCFLATYGDGVAHIDINKLVQFHEKKNKVATLTGLHARSKYGLIKEKDNEVISLHEKPVLKDLINGGFFVFNKSIFDWIKEDRMLEEQTLPLLAKKRQLAVFKHEGFWHCMDTYKDFISLNELWSSNNTAPWAVWEKKV